jgi:four helix bundle protein
MFDFQKLVVYQKSKNFHISCKAILKTIKPEKYVIDQLGRASCSIVLNIAEGSAKVSSKDRKNYFTTARGSVFECVAILDLLKDEGEVKEEKYNDMVLIADELSRLLFTMIKNLGD